MGPSIEKCEEKDAEELLSFLKRELNYHTFILADIYHYGFDKPYQQIYVERKAGEISAVFLRYFTNLILAGTPGEDACREIWGLHEKQVRTVMGKAELVEQFTKWIREISEKPVAKELYVLKNGEKLYSEGECVCAAGEKEIDVVYGFLMTIPGFRELYGEKEMIRNRIRNKEGEHLYFSTDKEIKAHANTAAATPWACMIGGVAVGPAYRHRGFGHRIVSAAARRALENGQRPIVFSEWPQEQNLFCDLGFQKIGNWGVLNLTEKIT